MGVLGHEVTELHPGIDLVRRLVPGESGVALDAKQRATDFARVCGKVLGDSAEWIGEVVDEVERRLADDGFEAILVGLEPLPLVVLLEVAKESEELGREVSRCHESQGTRQRRQKPRSPERRHRSRAIDPKLRSAGHAPVTHIEATRMARSGYSGAAATTAFRTACRPSAPASPRPTSNTRCLRSVRAW